MKVTSTCVNVFGALVLVLDDTSPAQAFHPAGLFHRQALVGIYLLDVVVAQCFHGSNASSCETVVLT